MARTTRSPGDLPAGLAQLRRRTGQSLKNEYRGMERALRDYALRQVSGRISQYELKRLGHPYARRRGRPTLSPLPINVQSGRLRRSFRTFRRRELVTQMQFTARHAKYVLSETGTRRMVPRGFWQSFREFYEREKRALFNNISREIWR